MTSITIQDGCGTGYYAQVDSENRLRVHLDLFDEEFRLELKKLIKEALNEMAEGHILGTGDGNE